ncbi:MAG: single-stranded DNA-binding protein, partial [Thermomicrobiales bacterium]
RSSSEFGSDREEITTWDRISGWGITADRMLKLTDMQSLTKGKRILVEGNFTPRQWIDNDGKRRLSLDVMARDFELLQSPAGMGSGGMGGGRDVGATWSDPPESGFRGGSDNSQGGGRAPMRNPAPGDSFGGQRGGGSFGGGGSRPSRQDEDFGPNDVDDVPF